MSGFLFEHKEAFYYLVALLLALWGLKYFFAKLQLKKMHGRVNLKLLPLLTATLSAKKRKWKERLQILVLALFILSYARPQASEGRQTVKNEGIELLILFDVSNSMLAEDTKPSRLRLAQSELGRLINMSGGDRIGLVAFAGSAVLLSPLTADQEAIRLYLETLDVDVVSTQGTNYTLALREAREAFQRGGLGDQEGSQVTRAVLIASDGEDHEPGAYDEAKKLIADGIHIFALAFGTESGAPIPIRDEQGILRGYKKDESGKEVMSKTKGTVLKELVEIGKGSFYHASIQGEGVKNLRADIAELKKVQFETGEVKSYAELYQYFLLIGFVLALIEFWLGDRKSKGRIWRGRFEVASE